MTWWSVVKVEGPMYPVEEEQPVQAQQQPQQQPVQPQQKAIPVQSTPQVVPPQGEIADEGQQMQQPLTREQLGQVRAGTQRQAVGQFKQISDTALQLANQARTNPTDAKPLLGQLRRALREANIPEA
jgi:hypothetical protein